jgi:hypothetical protein
MTKEQLQEILCRVWCHEISADDGFDELEEFITFESENVETP